MATTTPPRPPDFSHNHEAGATTVPADVLESMATSVDIERERLRLRDEHAELIRELIIAWAREKLRVRELEARLLAAAAGAGQ